MNKQAAKYGDFVLTALFAAIIFLLAFTPIGYVNLVIIKATILHVPVIVGSILLGPKKGAVLGAVFGVTSVINNTMAPQVLSFAFSPFIAVPPTPNGSPWALLIAFVPRILVGIVPYYVYTLLQRLFKQNKSGEYLSIAVSGVLGSVTNTVLVMGLIYFLFNDAYAAAKGINTGAVAGVVLGLMATNGIPEAIVAAVISVAVCKPLLKLRRKNSLT